VSVVVQVRQGLLEVQGLRQPQLLDHSSQTGRQFLQLLNLLDSQLVDLQRLHLHLHLLPASRLPG
jgi:hypothetical protein